MDDDRSRDDVSKELTGFLADIVQREIGPDDDYFALGLVNSLVALELVTFVEQRYGFTVEVEDLDLNHFRTVRNLTGFVMMKSAA
jgi:acyl carrier protein